jgi:lipopolysaccharide transport system permease protein
MYLYQYRELIKNLVVSDLKAKYANSVLGFAWSMINPLAMFIVYYLIFSNMFKSEGDYAAYLLVGMVTWRFFSNGTSYAMGSIVGKSSLVTKIFIPRELLTLSIAISNMISSLIEFTVLIALLLLLGTPAHPTILLFPVLQIMFFLIVYGFGLVLSSLYVYFRDMAQIWEVVIQAGFFLSPIVYKLSLIPDEYRSLFLLNPLTVLIGMYRDIFIYGTIPGLWDFAFIAVFGIVMVAIGSLVFKPLSRRFAEVV